MPPLLYNTKLIAARTNINTDWTTAERTGNNGDNHIIELSNSLNESVPPSLRDYNSLIDSNNYLPVELLDIQKLGTLDDLVSSENIEKDPLYSLEFIERDTLLPEEEGSDQLIEHLTTTNYIQRVPSNNLQRQISNTILKSTSDITSVIHNSNLSETDRLNTLRAKLSPNSNYLVQVRPSQLLPRTVTVTATTGEIPEEESSFLSHASTPTHTIDTSFESSPSGHFNNLPFDNRPSAIHPEHDSISITSTEYIRDMIERSHIIALILGLIILVTFAGNVLVCLSVIKVRKLRHPSNYLLISLAISDLCVACVVMPFGLYSSINDKWQLGRLLCNIYVVSDVTSCTASILNLCVISIDRYLAITRPLTYCVKRTTRLMMILIAIVWICACLISVPPLLISGNEYGTADEPRCEVSQSLWYQLYATCISFYIPLIVMICLYYNIYTAAKRVVEAEQRATTGLHVNNNNNNNNNNCSIPINNDINIAPPPTDKTTAASANSATKNNHKSSSLSGLPSLSFVNHLRGSSGGAVQLNNPVSHGTLSSSLMSTSSSRTSSVMRERKASVTLGVIMSAFTICWLPFFIIALLRPFSETVNSLPRTFVLLTLWLGYANSLLNPIIYVTFHHDFRNAFKHLLCLRCMTINEHIRKDEYKSQYGETHYQENIRKMRGQQNQQQLQQQQQQQQLLSKKLNQL